METKFEYVEDKDLPQLLHEDGSRKNNVNATAEDFKSMDTESIDLGDKVDSLLNSHLNVASSPAGEVKLDFPQLLCKDGSLEKNNVNTKAEGLKSTDTKSIDLEVVCEDGSSEKNNVNAKGVDRKSIDFEVKGDRFSNSQFYVASSSKEEVKLCLICDTSSQSDFWIPSIDEVVKVVEDECIQNYGASVLFEDDPKKDSYFFCPSCPLERSENNVSSSCKGHLVRKCIRECWCKYGCNKNCGNRVVQRGITGNLQVFWMPEVNGWGLQTVESLPRGAFVCEYIGEIETTLAPIIARTYLASFTKREVAAMEELIWDYGY
ncbi:set domain protein, putative [Ricinus communis]|uniref:Set domain protein, putative n=1 Tax=Ricinus communis TaxID=3988 RepID=B9SQU4_RICCO|nr:set domain protein, putative [Ricinus communis]